MGKKSNTGFVFHDYFILLTINIPKFYLLENEEWKTLRKKNKEM